jgi:hypothetical protein
MQHSLSPIDAETRAVMEPTRFPLRPEVDLRNIKSRKGSRYSANGTRQSRNVSPETTELKLGHCAPEESQNTEAAQPRRPEQRVGSCQVGFCLYSASARLLDLLASHFVRG